MTDWSESELAELGPMLRGYIVASLPRKRDAHRAGCVTCGEVFGKHPGRRSRFCPACRPQERLRAAREGMRRLRADLKLAVAADAAGAVVGCAQKVPGASEAELGNFVPGDCCHENVCRWMEINPEHGAVRGWIASNEVLFDKHSVVDTGSRLIDVTLRVAKECLPFIRHPGPEAEFWSMPPQMNLGVCDADAIPLDRSEIAVESCDWVREIAFIDGRWVTTCHRRGYLASQRR